jgi:hypothetical protein
MLMKPIDDYGRYRVVLPFDSAPTPAIARFGSLATAGPLNPQEAMRARKASAWLMALGVTREGAQQLLAGEKVLLAIDMKKVVELVRSTQLQILDTNNVRLIVSQVQRTVGGY